MPLRFKPKTRTGKILFYFLGLYVVTLGGVGYGIYQEFQYRQLRLSILDVGQGDAILIQLPYPARANILVDGGPDNVVIERLGETLPFYDRTIDLLILTHPDADHVTGLVEVFDRFEVSRVLYTNVNYSSQVYEAFLTAIDVEKAKKIIAGEGGPLLATAPVRLEVLYPKESLAQTKPKETNATSIIFKLSYGEFDMLFTGDATAEVEKSLLGKSLESEVLKVGHHGSKTSSSVEFLRAVKPLLAVVSAGKDNKFKHPTPEVVVRIKDLGIGLISTIDSGTIRIYSNATTFWVGQ